MYFCNVKQSLLAHINSPKDLKKLSVAQLPTLAKELREFIIDVVSEKGGHLGASLGVVELTIALHYVFDTPNDQLVWDVGHQAYGHKILTGRRDNFVTNRRLHGISGFPKREESEYDAFGTGHSSTSISAVLGMALASALKGEKQKQHIAVIGDASIASGMAFEGLNHAGVTDANMLVVLNDNAIGIDPSVGALKEYLTKVKKKKNVAQANIIKALNFDYYGPFDGHDFEVLIAELEKAKATPGPKFLHLITTKGKGLQKAEEDQITYHAPGKFDKITGERIVTTTKDEVVKYQDVFGKTLVELADSNDKIIGITPAMPTGSSLKYMMAKYPSRAFDVGIAEQHAVTLAAGMATQGFIPFCTIYSTFLQRAYDQLIHDVALQNLPVIFCVDRAGLVGEDGPTHHGVFDIAYLKCIPNLTIIAPPNEQVFRNVLYTVQLEPKGPIAIRYPRGKATGLPWQLPFEKVDFTKWITYRAGADIAILSVGTMANIVEEAINSIEVTTQQRVGHYNALSIKPIDKKSLQNIVNNYKVVVTVEDGTIIGGFGESIAHYVMLHDSGKKVITMGVEDAFVEHGKVEELHEICKIDVSSIARAIENNIKNLDIEFP